jgi:hypothetical protein
MRSVSVLLGVGAVLVLVGLAYFTHGHLSKLPLGAVVAVMALAFVLLSTASNKKGK